MKFICNWWLPNSKQPDEVSGMVIVADNLTDAAERAVKAIRRQVGNDEFIRLTVKQRKYDFAVKPRSNRPYYV